VAGLLNKQAAAELGISEITLQIHRSNAMRKMERAPSPSWFALPPGSAFPSRPRNGARACRDEAHARTRHRRGR